MTINILPTSTPEAQGIPSGAILAFLQTAEATIDALHSMMIVRHGNIVAQGWWSPYNADERHMLFSLSKSFTSTAVGLAVSEGHFSVDDTVLSFFPESAPDKISDNLAKMKVRHLLSMSTGHHNDTSDAVFEAPAGHMVEAFLNCPVEHEPGTHFLYNTGASYILAAIVHKVTGMTLMEYLTPRLFEPMGIRDIWWETSGEGVEMGGYGLNVKTEDIARFGQLYLQKGMWNGQQIIPETWVQQATSEQVSNRSIPPEDNSDWQQGYGYQFWRSQHNVYRGDGAFGQFCIVMPDQDAVIAITSGVGDMQAVIDLIWDILLPAMGAAPLPENPSATAQLQRKLAGLSLKPVAGKPTSPLAEQVTGKTYNFDTSLQKVWQDRHAPSEESQLIHAITLDLHGYEGGTITVRDSRGDNTVNFGYGAWEIGQTQLQADEIHKIASSGAWVEEETFAVQIYMFETPWRYTLTFQFGQGGVRYQSEVNVSFGPTTSPALIGTPE